MDPAQPASADPLRPAYFEPVPLAGHGLVDSGEGWKLERFGDRLVARPDPQALWARRLGPADWDRADLVFEREEQARLQKEEREAANN